MPWRSRHQQGRRWPALSENNLGTHPADRTEAMHPWRPGVRKSVARPESSVCARIPGGTVAVGVVIDIDLVLDP